MAGPLECTSESVGAGEPAIVTVRGEVDLATAPELEAYVQRAFESDPSSVVLDFEALTFIDSSGLRALVTLSKEAGRRGTSLALRRLPRHARRVLEVTGLGDFFELAPDPEGPAS